MKPLILPFQQKLEKQQEEHRLLQEKKQKAEAAKNQGAAATDTFSSQEEQRLQDIAGKLEGLKVAAAKEKLAYRQKRYDELTKAQAKAKSNGTALSQADQEELKALQDGLEDLRKQTATMIANFRRNQQAVLAQKEASESALAPLLKRVKKEGKGKTGQQIYAYFTPDDNRHLNFLFANGNVLTDPNHPRAEFFKKELAEFQAKGLNAFDPNKPTLLGLFLLMQFEQYRNLAIADLVKKNENLGGDEKKADEDPDDVRKREEIKGKNDKKIEWLASKAKITTYAKEYNKALEKKGEKPQSAFEIAKAFFDVVNHAIAKSSNVKTVSAEVLGKYVKKEDKKSIGQAWAKDYSTEGSSLSTQEGSKGSKKDGSKGSESDDEEEDEDKSHHSRQDKGSVGSRKGGSVASRKGGSVASGVEAGESRHSQSERSEVEDKRKQKRKKPVQDDMSGYLEMPVTDTSPGFPKSIDRAQAMALLDSNFSRQIFIPRFNQSARFEQHRSGLIVACYSNKEDPAKEDGVDHRGTNACYNDITAVRADKLDPAAPPRIGIAKIENYIPGVDRYIIISSSPIGVTQTFCSTKEFEEEIAEFYDGAEREEIQRVYLQKLYDQTIKNRDAFAKQGFSTESLRSLNEVIGSLGKMLAEDERGEVDSVGIAKIFAEPYNFTQVLKASLEALKKDDGQKIDDGQKNGSILQAQQLLFADPNSLEQENPPKRKRIDGNGEFIKDGQKVQGPGVLNDEQQERARRRAVEAYSKHLQDELQHSLAEKALGIDVSDAEASNVIAQMRASDAQRMKGVKNVFEKETKGLNDGRMDKLVNLDLAHSNIKKGISILRSAKAGPNVVSVLCAAGGSDNKASLATHVENTRVNVYFFDGIHPVTCYKNGQAIVRPTKEDIAAGRGKEGTIFMDEDTVILLNQNTGKEEAYAMKNWRGAPPDELEEVFGAHRVQAVIDATRNFQVKAVYYDPATKQREMAFSLDAKPSYVKVKSKAFEKADLGAAKDDEGTKEATEQLKRLGLVAGVTAKFAEKRKPFINLQAGERNKFKDGEPVYAVIDENVPVVAVEKVGAVDGYPAQGAKLLIKLTPKQGGFEASVGEAYLVVKDDNGEQRRYKLEDFRADEITGGKPQLDLLKEKAKEATVSYAVEGVGKGGAKQQFFVEAELGKPGHTTTATHAKSLNTGRQVFTRDEEQKQLPLPTNADKDGVVR